MDLEDDLQNANDLQVYNPNTRKQVYKVFDGFIKMSISIKWNLGKQQEIIKILKKMKKK